MSKDIEFSTSAKWGSNSIKFSLQAVRVYSPVVVEPDAPIARRKSGSRIWIKFESEQVAKDFEDRFFREDVLIDVDDSGARLHINERIPGRNIEYSLQRECDVVSVGFEYDDTH